MTTCTCGAVDKDEADNIVASEEVAATEALDTPIDLDKAENLMKEMEETLAKLHELIDSFETEKMEDEDEEEDEEEEDEEEEAEEEEDEDEEKAEEEDEEKSAKPDVAKALEILKTAGINVYAGKKRTPASKPRSTPKPTNWSDFSKSLEEIDRLAEKAGRGY